MTVLIAWLINPNLGGLFGSLSFWESQHVNYGPGVAGTRTEGCECVLVGGSAGRRGQRGQRRPCTLGYSHLEGAALIHLLIRSSIH